VQRHGIIGSRNKIKTEINNIDIEFIDDKLHKVDSLSGNQVDGRPHAQCRSSQLVVRA
jgi:hypothetical protein